MSNIVCQKCRRLVRTGNIDYHGGDYFCTHCQTSYKLPASYYKRGEFDIPILPKNSDLKVSKTEKELLIELPMNVITLPFIISTVSLVFMFAIFLPSQLAYENEEFPFFLAVLAGIFFLTLINAMAKKSILVSGRDICFCKNILGFKINDVEPLKKITRVRQIEVDSNSGSGFVLSHRFVEVYFSRENSWEFGHNLDKADRKYIIAELKLYRLYDQVT